MLSIRMERIFSVGHTDVFQMFTFRRSHSNVVHLTQFRISAIQLRLQELPKYLYALSYIQKQIRQLWSHRHTANITTLLTPAVTFQTWKYANETRQFNSSSQGTNFIHSVNSTTVHCVEKNSPVFNVACFCAFVIHLLRKNNEQNTLRIYVQTPNGLYCTTNWNMFWFSLNHLQEVTESWGEVYIRNVRRYYHADRVHDTQLWKYKFVDYPINAGRNQSISCIYNNGLRFCCCRYAFWCVYVCLCIFMCVYVCLCIFVCLNVFMYVHVCLCVFMGLWIFMYVYVCLCIFIMFLCMFTTAIF
jgi:nuclear pore complex protein Nup62